jgi:aquaporin Z
MLGHISSRLGCGRRNFPWQRVPGCLGAQFVGGVAAAALLRARLISTILGTVSGARNIGSNGALAVGGYIALAGLWAAPISGASMNQVRSFAPDLIRGDLLTTWIYLAGPMTGAMLAVGFEWIFKGKATAAGTLVARGE